MMTSHCPECRSATLQEESTPFTVHHNGQSVIIQDRRMVCQDCGHAGYAGSQISEHELAVAAAIREIDGLLSAADLQRIRLKYGFRQTDMERMLSTGSKTWTRWERGKVPQSKAADTLIRLIGDDPDIARRLMEQSGIDNPEAAAVFHQIEENAKHLGRTLIRAELRLLRDDASDEFANQLADRAFEAVRDVRRRALDDAKAA